ncbi:MAG TPA: SDR family oxidoreductase [Cytophagaceae bacterium]
MKYTLITGASRGIGEAMAKYCASKKFNLVLVARTEEKLKELCDELKKRYGVDAKYYSTDLTDCDSIRQLYGWCGQEGLQIDKLINNAGIGIYGKFTDLSLEDQMNLIRLNQLATVTLTYTFLPMLRGNDKGYLLNVSSTACFQPIPYMSIYAATQAFLHSFTLALREELKHTRVNVSVLCPGPTATGFFEKAGLQQLPVNSNEIKMTPEEVAQIAIEDLLENESEIIPGTNNRIGAYLSKLFPNKLIIKTVGSLFAPKY